MNTFTSVPVGRRSLGDRHGARALAPTALHPAVGGASRCACGGGCPRCAAQAGERIQPKLDPNVAVSEPHDPLEREADRIAESVTRGQANAAPRLAPRAALAGPGDELAPAGGRPLESAARADMERRFGADFGAVRVHTGHDASRAAERYDAYAYTAGRNIVFGEGQYAPHSDSGRRLLAHELAHTLQQARAAAPHADAGARGTPAPIQRAPKDADKAEISWATVHMDLGKAEVVSADNTYHLWNFAVGQSKLKKAHHDFLQGFAASWDPHSALEVQGRASSSGKEDNNAALSCDRLKAVIRFLKDTGFDVASAVTGTACQGSADPLPGTELLDTDDKTTLGAKMAQNRSVDLIVRYAITHSSGTKVVVPGFKPDEKEYGASGAASSLLAPVKPRADKPITGGFKSDLDVDTGFATGVDTAASKEVDALVKANEDRIDKALVPILRHVAEDKFVLAALKSFLEVDKGKIVALAEGGKYDDKVPPTLNIGTGKGEQDTRDTFVHELLHYVFDKSDSSVGEAKDSGGADHPAVIAIETRFHLIDLIRSGKSPLDKKVESDFGEFLKGDDFFVKMNEAIAKDDRAGLKALVAKPEFMRAVVDTPVFAEVSKKSVNWGSNPVYFYTPDQLRDLAFMWAQNGAIVRHAMRIAAEVADSTNTPLKDVFAKAEWKTKMNTFLAAFVTGLRKARTKGVTSLEAGL